jgi:hypothetical protein
MVIGRRSAVRMTRTGNSGATGCTGIATIEELHGCKGTLRYLWLAAVRRNGDGRGQTSVLGPKNYFAPTPYPSGSV